MESLWFIDNLARVHVRGADTQGRHALVEVGGRRGDMPPLHVHHREDEVFYVLEGTLTLHLPGRSVELRAGSAVTAPRGVPHTYRVESETARWLAFCEPAGFDALVLETSVPAPRDELPPPGREHDTAALAAAAARQGIELLGPPGALPIGSAPFEEVGGPAAAVRRSTAAPSRRRSAVALEVAGDDRADGSREPGQQRLDDVERDVRDGDLGRRQRVGERVGEARATSTPFAAAFVRVTSTAVPSTSTADTGPKPSFAAAIESTPEPQPTSRSEVGSSSCRSSSVSRVVG